MLRILHDFLTYFCINS